MVLRFLDAKGTALSCYVSTSSSCAPQSNSLPQLRVKKSNKLVGGVFTFQFQNLLVYLFCLVRVCVSLWVTLSTLQPHRFLCHGVLLLTLLLKETLYISATSFMAFSLYVGLTICIDQCGITTSGSPPSEWFQNLITKWRGLLKTRRITMSNALHCKSQNLFWINSHIVEMSRWKLVCAWLYRPGCGIPVGSWQRSRCKGCRSCGRAPGPGVCPQYVLAGHTCCPQAPWAHHLSPWPVWSALWIGHTPTHPQKHTADM